MNQSELFFLTIALSLGLGSGVALSQKYGWLGFVTGFAGSVIFVFLFLGLCRILAVRRNNKDRK